MGLFLVLGWRTGVIVHRPDHSARGQQPEVGSLEVIHLENEYVHIDDNINIKIN